MVLIVLLLVTGSFALLAFGIKLALVVGVLLPPGLVVAAVLIMILKKKNFPHRNVVFYGSSVAILSTLAIASMTPESFRVESDPMSSNGFLSKDSLFFVGLLLSSAASGILPILFLSRFSNRKVAVPTAPTDSNVELSSVEPSRSNVYKPKDRLIATLVLTGAMLAILAIPQSRANLICPFLTMNMVYNDNPKRFNWISASSGETFGRAPFTTSLTFYMDSRGLEGKCAFTSHQKVTIDFADGSSALVFSEDASDKINSDEVKKDGTRIVVTHTWQRPGTYRLKIKNTGTRLMDNSQNLSSQTI